MPNPVKYLALLLTASLSACCTVPYDRVILLPSPEGKVGKVAVLKKEGEIVVDTAYGSAELGHDGQVSKQQLTQADLAGFADVRSAMPPRPISFYLYFLEGSDQLTPESVARLPEVLAEIATRPVPEVVVVGHSDTVGSLEDNDRLALARAEAVRQMLLSNIASNSVRAESRGEREPLVVTPDETAEPRNRRVEVSVR